MSILIPLDKFCRAKHYSGWCCSIFGRPKLTIICGSCSAQFSTRDYRNFTNVENKPDGMVACCKFCGMWNRMPITYNNA